MKKLNAIEKHDWLSPNGPKKVMNDLKTNGFSWFSFENSAELVAKNYNSFAKQILGKNIKSAFHTTVELDPKSKGRGYLSTNKSASFHTDISPGLQNDLQLMVCERNSVIGGETLFVDLWRVLDRIKKHDPELYFMLFTEARPLLTVRGAYWARSVRWDNNRLICSHVPSIDQNDLIGEKFKEWIENEDVYKFKLEPDDCYILNNLRMAHGRTAFKGNKRLLLRTNINLIQPIQLKCPHEKVARYVKSTLEHIQDKF